MERGWLVVGCSATGTWAWMKNCVGTPVAVFHSEPVCSMPRKGVSVSSDWLVWLRK
jgi:hypothetical protein